VPATKTDEGVHEQEDKRMTLQNLLTEVERLPKGDKWRLVRHLLDELEDDKKHTPPEAWASFVERMYGALADDPIERPPQLPLEDREPIE